MSVVMTIEDFFYVQLNGFDISPETYTRPVAKVLIKSITDIKSTI